MYADRLLPPASGESARSVVQRAALVAIRQSRLALCAFVGIMLGITIYVLRQPPYYESYVKILVKRGRLESVVSSGTGAVPRGLSGVTREEVNTELELLRSQDLLRRVVFACGLNAAGARDPSTGGWVQRPLQWTGTGKEKEQEALTDQAVSKLSRTLRIEPMRESNLIRASYTSNDREEPVRVLNALSSLYVEKHTEVHRPRGAFDFFRTEAERSRRRLRQLEAQMKVSASEPEGAAPQLVKEATLHKMAEFEADLERTRANIAVAEQRILALEGLAASIPERTVTEIRTSSKGVEGLRSALLELELKRTELAQLYQPGYPELQIIETKVAQTRKAIEALEKTPPLEQVTDREPAHDWTVSELMKARAELSGLKAQAAATETALREYGEKVQRLIQKEISSEDLTRQVMLAKEAYMAYVRKQEEARISDELDRHQIVNVVIAEPATVSSSPAGPNKARLLLLGAIFAAAASVGLAFIVDRLDPTLRTAEEVQTHLSVPVAAVLLRTPLALPAAYRANTKT